MPLDSETLKKKIVPNVQSFLIVPNVQHMAYFAS